MFAGMENELHVLEACQPALGEIIVLLRNLHNFDKNEGTCDQIVGHESC